MNTKEAIQAMLDGKKVRSCYWSIDAYIFFDGHTFLDENGNIATDYINKVKEWVLYQEEKILYEWMFSLKYDKTWYLDSALATEEEAEHRYKSLRKGGMVKEYKKTGRLFKV